jgi:hypothetical protein
LDISGKNNNDVHSENKRLIFVIFEVSHFEISGKDDNDEQQENTELIYSIFYIF